MEKIYMHFDMDAFFASIEQRDNGKYKGKPIAIGFGVITTASYEAKNKGVKSGMTSFEALKLCPELEFVSIRKDVYSEVGKRIQKLILKLTDKCEFASIDEGYVDITSFIYTSGTEKEKHTSLINFANRFKKYIYKNTSLTCSVGIGFNKVSAKIASDINKPNGIFIFKNIEDFKEYIMNKNLSIIPGIGKKTIQYLNQLKIVTVNDLYKISRNELVHLFGQNKGDFLYNVIRGNYNSEIDNNRKRQSYGKETTFNRNVNNEEEILNELMKQSIHLSKRLKKENEYTKTISLKIRYSDFSTFTKSKTIYSSTNDYLEIYNVIADIYRLLAKKDEVRLIGIHLSSITKSNYKQLSINDLYKDFKINENK